MKLDNIRERLKKAIEEGDREELRRLASDLGEELPRRRLDVIAEFRGLLTKYQPKGEYEEAYVAALRELSVSYNLAAAAQQREEADFNFLLQQGCGPLLLALMSEKPKSRFELIKQLAGWTNERVKHYLHIFCDPDVNLVDVLEGKPRLYRLSLRGEHFAEKFKADKEAKS